MKIAIWSVTRNGGEKAVLISKSIGGHVFALNKFNIQSTIQFESLSAAVHEYFNLYDHHVFIMSTGIVVRTISPLIKGKDTDPAVVVIDENITFAISLLSGHMGGANLFTENISKSLGITPIITTSSDITGKVAIDILAEKLNCRMRSLDEAKKLTSLIVDNKVVELLLPENIKINTNTKIKSYFHDYRENNGTENHDSRDSQCKEFKECASELVDNDIAGYSNGVVIISNREVVDVTQFYPQNIVVGIGCRKKIPIRGILNAVLVALSKVNISERSIKHLATVDLKKDELGIVGCSKFFGVELKIVSRSEIEECKVAFKDSDFVNANIGVSSVSAPVAYLTSDKKGKFLIEKFILDGVTVSVYENSTM